MNVHVNAALAAEHQRDLERAAGCCSAAAQHLRSIPARFARFAWLRRSPAGQTACCA